MTPQSGRRVVLALFLVTLAFHVAVLSQDFPALAKNGFLYDDSFYAFKIAHNIAQGTGVTFDGLTATNGFQPLYVFMLVPIFGMTGSNLIAPIYVALLLSALWTALTVILLYALLRRYVGGAAAAVTSVLWAFSPVVTRQTANGLETSLALFLFAACVYYYVSRIRSNTRPAGRDFALLGVLLGLAALARVDQLFVALVMLLDYLIVVRARKAGARALTGVLAAAGAGILVYSPWLLYNWIAFGRLVQDSGSATRYLSMAYAPFFGLGSADTLRSGPGAGFIWGHLVHALSVLKVSPPVHVAFRALEKFGAALHLSSPFVVVSNVAGLVLLGLCIYYVIARGKERVFENAADLRFLLLIASVFIAAYSFYAFGVFFFIRYLYPIYFIACIYAAFFVQSLFGRFRARPAMVRALAGVALVAYGGAFAYMSVTCAFRSKPTYFFYDVAQWVQAHTTQADRIGVFQGGAIGYLSDRDVINLDGKVNHDALSALQGRYLGAYMARHGIDIVLDNSNVLDLFLGVRNERGSGAMSFVQIMRGADVGAPGWSGYRITWPPGGAGVRAASPHSK